MGGKVYKIVRRDGDKLVSSNVCGRAAVEYRVGEWVSAPKWLAEKGYHLFAFKDFYSARRCYSAIDKQEVWLAEAEGVTTELPNPLSIMFLNHGKIVPHKYECLSSYRVVYPEGTVMCERIKLIERVYPQG